MTVTTTVPAQAPTGIISDTEVTADTIPVTLTAHTGYRTMLRVITAAEAGDILDITGRARVTNDIGYNVGVGYHLWMYDCELGSGSTWTQISLSNGDNVDSQVPNARHHMPLHLEHCYQVPSDWPAGHRMVVVFRAEAHSTAAQTGDTINADQMGVLTVRRWSTPDALSARFAVPERSPDGLVSRTVAHCPARGDQRPLAWP